VRIFNGRRIREVAHCDSNVIYTDCTKPATIHASISSSPLPLAVLVLVLVAGTADLLTFGIL
jgi:hypothetical protein